MPYTPVSFLPSFSSITETLNLIKGLMSVIDSPPDLIISIDLCSPKKFAVTCFTAPSFFLKYSFTLLRTSSFEFKVFCSMGFISL